MTYESLNPYPLRAGQSLAHATAPKLLIARSAYRDSLTEICRRPPESGGLLLGPIGANDITDFYFDATAECTGGTYSPDTVTLKRKLVREWIPSGLDFKGFIHSHPRRMDLPSGGDLRYIARLLEINPEMSQFAVPIVIPIEFRMRAFIVRREQPLTASEARLVLF